MISENSQGKAEAFNWEIIAILHGYYIPESFKMPQEAGEPRWSFDTRF